MQKLVSEIDKSVNFVQSVGEKESIESRYVRRNLDYFICYLSSQTACSMGCRMCHLTATKQMLGRDVTSTEFLEQALQVLEHYKTQSKADIVNYNFMARGEPFDSLVFTEQCNYILKELAELAYDYDLVPDFNISTILPTETTPKRLWKMFKGIQPNIYYSLYSLNKEFRRKWLPNAMEPKSAFEVLAEWQSFSHKIPRVHFALIKGENDNERDLNELCEFVKSTGVVVDFNIVRYNPFDSDHGEEGNYMLAYDILKPNFRTKIIDRVGFDVMASCGMFHE